MSVDDPNNVNSIDHILNREKKGPAITAAIAQYEQCKKHLIKLQSRLKSAKQNSEDLRLMLRHGYFIETHEAEPSPDRRKALETHMCRLDNEASILEAETNNAAKAVILSMAGVEAAAEREDDIGKQQKAKVNTFVDSYLEKLDKDKAATDAAADDDGSTVEQLSSLTVTDDDDGNGSSDTSDCARPSEEAVDPELWKPHPPTEDCPICFVPLPLKEEESEGFFTCCGQLVCCSCIREHIRAVNVTNMKREKKEQQPLEKTCPFCRSPSAKSDTEQIQQYEDKVRKGDTKAALIVAGRYLEGLNGLPKDTSKALELFHRSADMGSAEATAMLGLIYTSEGWGVPIQKKKGLVYLENATKMGSVTAREFLGVLEAEKGNTEHAIRHFKLSASAGHVLAMKALWKYFYKGKLCKAELEDTLRAHQEACDGMNSKDRERFVLWQKAKADNNVLLRNILGMYYAGKMNAKELNKQLKGHGIMTN
mmetsp:Transcript_8821/g.24892  ORF Transcript_8821/g.24892 Transcript_8821/m.24892 type:complete len:480 (-) Transcript_8821:566-2005(-)